MKKECSGEELQGGSGQRVRGACGIEDAGGQGEWRKRRMDR